MVFDTSTNSYILDLVLCMFREPKVSDFLFMNLCNNHDVRIGTQRRFIC